MGMVERPASKRRQIVRDASWYVTATYITQVLAVLSGLVTRRFLGPYLMGVVSSLQVLQTYATYTHLGTLQAAERELPYGYSKEDTTRTEQIERTTLSFSMLTGLAGSLILLLIAAVGSSKNDIALTVGLVVFSALTFIQQFFNYYTVRLRSRKEFILLSKNQAAMSALGTVLIVIGVVLFNVYGLYAQRLITMLAQVAFLYLNSRYVLRPGIDLVELKRLLVIGFPLLIYSIAFATLLNVDRISVLKWLGLEQLGIYSIALMVNLYIFNVPNVVSTVLYPRVQEAYASGKDNAQAIAHYVTIPCTVVAYLLPVVIGGFYLVVPPIVVMFLPDYVSGILAYKIILIGSFFIALIHMPGQFLITINKQVRMIVIIGVALLVGFGLNRLFIYWGWGISGVAIGTSVSYFLFCFALLFYALAHFSTWKGIAIFSGKLLIPAIYSSLLLWGTTKLINTEGADLGGLTLGVVAQGAVFLLLYAPMLWYINRETQALSILIDILRKKRAAAR
jgi:O-antigen/teichoic acid export membrane protein